MGWRAGGLEGAIVDQLISWPVGKGDKQARTGGLEGRREAAIVDQLISWPVGKGDKAGRWRTSGYAGHYLGGIDSTRVDEITEAKAKG